MKRILIISVFVLAILSGLFVFIFNKSSAGDFTSINGHSFELVQFGEGYAEPQTLIIHMDDNGYFYRETLNGHGVGNFEIWDGDKFYRYEAEYKHLDIIYSEEYNDVPVIAHPFVSEVLNQRIFTDMKKENLAHKTSEYSEYRLEAIFEEGTVVETFIIDHTFNRPSKYSYTLNDQVLQQFEIKNRKKTSKPIILSDYVDLDDIKKNGTISENKH